MSRTFMREFFGAVKRGWGRAFLNLRDDENFLLSFNILVIKAYLLVFLLPDVIPEISAITLSIAMVLLTAMFHSVPLYGLLNSMAWFATNFILGYCWRASSVLFAYVTLCSFNNELFEFFLDAYVLLVMAFSIVNPTEAFKVFYVDFRLQRTLLMQHLGLQLAMLRFRRPNRYCLSFISVIFTSMMLSFYVEVHYSLLFYAFFYDICLLYFFIHWAGIKMFEERRTRQLDLSVFQARF